MKRRELARALRDDHGRPDLAERVETPTVDEGAIPPVGDDGDQQQIDAVAAALRNAGIAGWE